jgi:hypothetical protein
MAMLRFTQHWARFTQPGRLQLPVGITVGDWATQLQRLCAAIARSGEEADFHASSDPVVRNMKCVLALCKEALDMMGAAAALRGDAAAMFADNAEDRLVGAKWTTLCFGALIMALETLSHFGFVGPEAPNQPWSCGDLLRALPTAAGAPMSAEDFNALLAIFTHLRDVRNKYFMHPSEKHELYEVVALYRRRSQLGGAATLFSTTSLADVSPENVVALAFFAHLTALKFRRDEVVAAAAAGAAMPAPPAFPEDLFTELRESGVFNPQPYPAHGPAPTAGGEYIVYDDAVHANVAVNRAMRDRLEACAYVLDNRDALAMQGLLDDRLMALRRFAAETTAAALYRAVVPGNPAKRQYNFAAVLPAAGHVGLQGYILESLKSAYSHASIAALWGYGMPPVAGAAVPADPILAMPMCVPATQTPGRLGAHEWDSIQAEAKSIAAAMMPLCHGPPLDAAGLAAAAALPGYATDTGFWSQATVVRSAAPPNYAQLWRDVIVANCDGKVAVLALPPA